MPFSCSDLKPSGQIVVCSSYSSFTIIESYVNCFLFLTLKLAFHIEDLEPKYLNNHKNSGRNRGPEPGSSDGDMRSPRGCVFGKRLALLASSCVGLCPQPEEQASLNRWILPSRSESFHALAPRWALSWMPGAIVPFCPHGAHGPGMLLEQDRDFLLGCQPRLCFCLNIS